MTLRLNYRDVARANCDTSRLGAFNGYAACNYRYFGVNNEPTDLGCAIGICDPKGEIPLSRNESDIHELITDKIVLTDSEERLKFIQRLHDFRADDNAWTDFLNACEGIDIPPCVFDIVKNIVTCEDVTPELYRQVMERIADET